MKVVGYCIHSGLICPCCTAQAIEHGEIVESKPRSKSVTRFNLKGYQPFVIPEKICTTDGSKVTPVFDTGYPDGFTCDDCGAVHE